MATFILCLKIFFVRILDVSLGTLRTMITVKGKNLYASLIGFFEILVWFLIVKEALNTDNTSIWVAISYALGFATGTYLGGILSSKFISGNLSLQIITNKLEIVNKLRDEGYGVTVMDALGIDDSEEELIGKYVTLESKNKQKVEWNKLRKAINTFLAKQRINEDKQLGPYFISRNIVIPKEGDMIDSEKFIKT